MRTSFIRTALAAAALVGLGSAAQAALLIRITDNTGVVTTSTCDTSAAQVGTNCVGFTYTVGSNFAAFAGTVGDFSFSNSTFGSNAPGSNGILGSFASTTNLNILSGAANQQLVVDFIATGFTLPVGPIKNLSGSSSQNDYATPTAGADQSYAFSILNDNLSSNFIVPGATLGSVGCGPVALLVAGGGCSAQAIVGPITPNFSLRDVATYNVVAANDNFQASSTVRVTVPEPASTALVGTALVALAMASRRRKAVQA